MSKSTKIIAGAGVAALAIAAVPAVASFAADSDVTSDTATYKLTIEDSTTLGNLNGKTGYFADVTKDATNGQTGQSEDAQGATVTTNDKDGFTLSVKGSTENEGAMKNTDNKSIPASITASGSYWYLGYATTDENITVTASIAPTASNQTVAESSKAVSKAPITSTFNYGISDVQESGTYTETVTYTLAAK